MVDWYLQVQGVLRSIESKARDALVAYKGAGKEVDRPINGYLRDDYQRLEALWAQEFSGDVPSALGRHVAWGMDNDYEDILRRDLQEVQQAADEKLRSWSGQQGKLGFEHLLHAAVAKASYEQYRNGHFRDAVLNSVIAVFDLIRSRSGSLADGDALIGEVFSLDRPRLVFSHLDTVSGRDDQKGFMQILKGAYQGIRNPKAHSLEHDLDATKTEQYLVFASLLARRVEECKSVPQPV